MPMIVPSPLAGEGISVGRHRLIRVRDSLSASYFRLSLRMQPLSGLRATYKSPRAAGLKSLSNPNCKFNWALNSFWSACIAV